MLHRNFCNKDISLVDMRTRLNPSKLLVDYNRFKYPNRYLLRLKHTKQELVQLPNISNYPELKLIKETGGEEMMYRAVQTFIEYAKIPENSEIAVHASRYYSGDTMLPDTWHSENYKKKAILCIHEERLDAGILQIKNKKETCTYDWRIHPVEMLILHDGDQLLHRYKVFSLNDGGYIDFMTFIY